MPVPHKRHGRARSSLAGNAKGAGPLASERSCSVRMLPVRRAGLVGVGGQCLDQVDDLAANLGVIDLDECPVQLKPLG